ncbi:penicillin-binding protein 2 [Candidatus Woesebacteria bacterium]|nr:penicillin-binding protein 2 [Candidatus Woesebacteria bacterium]
MIRISRNKPKIVDSIETRGKIALFVLYFGLFVITSRLFFWQIIKSDSLEAQAENQYRRSVTLTGIRGDILTSDGYKLATNNRVYTLFAQPNIIENDPQDLAQKITPLLLDELDEYIEASESSQKEEIAENFELLIKSKLEKKETKWISLKANISEDKKEKIENLKIFGIGFDEHLERYYPEASMAAHVTGFVGKDENSDDIGYFGIEGALEKELKARSAQNTVIADALGLQLSGQNSINNNSINGRDIVTTIRRDVQYLIEEQVEYAVKKYGAKSGEVVVMDPKTGNILGLAAYPDYSQAEFYKYDAEYHKNPSLSNLYEPGSTFKAITVSAGIEEGLIEPEIECTNCDKPRVFGKYTIRTWNDEYHPNITMEDGLAKSDNIAMIFIAEKLGIDTFKEYLHKFGVGEELRLDLQEDRSTPFPDEWGDVRLATTSFGQGVVVNTMQVLRVFATIANGGVMMRPTIIKSVNNNSTGEIIANSQVEERSVISKKTADKVTKMLISSAKYGEAQWIASKTYSVAGKTGTSQVVTENGYDNEKTIASFVGFSPPENPKFVMITKLVEPTTSPWAAETAAPLWYRIADKLNLLLN